MKIKKNTNMLLFRFGNYKKNDFIESHMKVIDKDGYVWLLKLGKRTSIDRLNEILNAGGWIVLRSPKADGSKSYIARFSEFSEEEPSDMIYPSYYNDILGDDSDDGYYEGSRVCQWFRVDMIKPIEETSVFIMSKTGKAVDEVIETTRTAVMFVKNISDISI